VDVGISDTRCTFVTTSVEEACETGLAAVRVASDVRSARTVACLTDLSHRLAPFSTEPAVRMLDEQISLLVQRGWCA
jgi:hypothetical protein